eukprot:gene2280-biopygen2192
MAEGARAVRCILNVLQDIVTVITPVPMCCNNQGAVYSSLDYAHSNTRAKRIEVRSMHAREMVKNATVDPVYLSTDQSTADIFTKHLHEAFSRSQCQHRALRHTGRRLQHCKRSEKKNLTMKTSGHHPRSGARARAPPQELLA